MLLRSLRWVAWALLAARVLAAGADPGSPERRLAAVALSVDAHHDSFLHPRGLTRPRSSPFSRLKLQAILGEEGARLLFALLHVRQGAHGGLRGSRRQRRRSGLHFREDAAVAAGYGGIAADPSLAGHRVAVRLGAKDLAGATHESCEGLRLPIIAGVAAIAAAGSTHSVLAGARVAMGSFGESSAINDLGLQRCWTTSPVGLGLWQKGTRGTIAAMPPDCNSRSTAGVRPSDQHGQSMAATSQSGALCTREHAEGWMRKRTLDLERRHQSALIALMICQGTRCVSVVVARTHERFPGIWMVGPRPWLIELTRRKRFRYPQ